MWMTMNIGLRNLRRRLSRTALTIAMICVGTLLIVFSIGLNEGPYADMIRMGTGTWNGQFQIQHKDFKDSPSLYKTISLKDHTVLSDLEKIEHVVATTARVEVAGLLSAGTRTAGAQLNGVMPDREQKLASLAHALKEGSFLTQPKDPEALPIVLGDGLAERLKVKIGDEIVYMGQAADGSIAAEIYELVGTLDSKIDELDASLALIRLQDAQELLLLQDRVHRIVGKTTHSDRALVAALRPHIKLEKNAKFYPWDILMPELHSSIESDRSGGQIFVFIIVLMVLLGTINTLLMSVFERTREIGVMKALGTKKSTLIAIILWESAWIAFLGVGIGVLLGTGLNIYFANVGIEFFDEPVEFGGMQLSTIYTLNTFRGNIQYPLYIFFSAVVGALWPAWRGSKLNPTEALRSY